MNRKDFEETTLLILSHSQNKTEGTLPFPCHLSSLFSMECVLSVYLTRGQGDLYSPLRKMGNDESERLKKNQHHHLKKLPRNLPGHLHSGSSQCVPQSEVSTGDLTKEFGWQHVILTKYPLTSFCSVIKHVEEQKSFNFLVYPFKNCIDPPSPTQPPLDKCDPGWLKCKEKGALESSGVLFLILRTEVWNSSKCGTKGIWCRSVLETSSVRLFLMLPIE